MSIKYAAAVAPLEMPASPKNLLTALAVLADENGRAYPSVTTLEVRTGLHRATIWRALEYLKRNGHVVVERTGHRGGNVYTIPSPSYPLLIHSAVARRDMSRPATCSKAQSDLSHHAMRHVAPCDTYKALQVSIEKPRAHAHAERLSGSETTAKQRTAERLARHTEHLKQCRRMLDPPEGNA